MLPRAYKINQKHVKHMYNVSKLPFESCKSTFELHPKGKNQNPPLGSGCPGILDNFSDPAPAKRLTPAQRVEDLSPPSEKALRVDNFAVTSPNGEGPVTPDPPLRIFGDGFMVADSMPGHL